MRDRVAARIDSLVKDDVPRRIWDEDFTLWRDDPAEITNRLGWLDVHRRIDVDELRMFAAEGAMRLEQEPGQRWLGHWAAILRRGPGGVNRRRAKPPADREGNGRRTSNTPRWPDHHWGSGPGGEALSALGRRSRASRYRSGGSG